MACAERRYGASMNESDGSYSLICPMYCWYPFMMMLLDMDHLWSFECGTSLNWTCTEIASDLLVVQRDCTLKTPTCFSKYVYTKNDSYQTMRLTYKCIYNHTCIYIYTHICDICMIFHKQRLSRSKQTVYLLSLFHVRDLSSESIRTMRIKTRGPLNINFLPQR